MRALIVRIQIVNTLGINEDYILVGVFFLCGCWKTLVRFSCTETGKPGHSMNQKIHKDSLIRWPWASLLFPSPTFKTPVWRSARETPASTRPIQNSKAVNWAMQGTSIFSHVTHPCPSKSLWQTTSLPYTCTKFKYENTPGNDCNIFVLNQIVTYALYILFSLSLHLGLEPIKLKVPFPLKIDQWTSMA